jgi:hypothetical protein
VELSRLTAPTLILWGDHDGMFTLEDQDALAALISNAALKLYAETGHGLHVEWPQRFVDDLEAFARYCDAQSGAPTLAASLVSRVRSPAGLEPRGSCLASKSDAGLKKAMLRLLKIGACNLRVNVLQYS